ncbi:MAG TPA: patatin-like phospholipase family protein [Mycobacteriales bacterium]|nr:patatin-like phospholipase family protein [Mycobacteriales bacterium]
MSRALVLGGGGVAGIAWELGILLGLHDAGIDLTGADRLVGTSAGSAVAAKVLGGVAVEKLYDGQLAPELLDSEIAADFDPEEMMREFGAALAGTEPGPAMFRKLGEYALRAQTVAEPVRRAVIERRLPNYSWPDRDLRVVAIDAISGVPQVFSRASGVDLVDAVAASCAVPGIWPPVTIGASRYIDGGMRSVTNLDEAAGCDRVVVISPTSELPFVPPDVRAAEDEVRRTAAVCTITADEESIAAMGANLLDPATARPAAQAGRAQAASHVAEVKAMWEG